jgi:hypothetical protein
MERYRSDDDKPEMNLKAMGFREGVFRDLIRWEQETADRQCGHHPAYAPTGHVSEPVLISAALASMRAFQLDPCKPWTWNSDCVRIYLATLELVGQLQVALHLRRLLYHFEESKKDPECLIII